MANKALITGVTGFGGSHLAEYLVAAGDTVCGFARTRNRLNNLGAAAKRIDFREIDLLDTSGIEAMLRDFRPDVVYHLAGEASALRSLQAPQETLRQNIIGTVNVLEAAKKVLPQPKIVLVTSSEMYGYVQPHQIPLREDAPLNPLHPYGLSKAAIHYVGTMYHRTFGLPVVEARAFNHIGPRQSTGFVVPDFARQIAEIALGKREPLVKVGNLNDERDFTDVRDVVRAYALLAEGGAPGNVYHICSGKAYRIQWILDTLIKLSGVNVRVETDPAKLRPSKMPIIAGSHEAISRELGWKPEISLEKGLADTLEYWKANV